jgi:phage terminase large subunit-like protein
MNAPLTDQRLIFSTPDWQERLRAGRVPFDLSRAGPLLNKRRAERVLQIFETLRLPDVSGQPYLREACGPWFKDIMKAMAGSIDPSGASLIKDVFCCVPKKSSKTSYAALGTLALMLAAPRPKADFLIVSPSLPISQLSFDQISGAIMADPLLRERMHVRAHLKQIVDRKSGCRLTVRSASMEVATGVRPSFTLIDECHLLSGPDSARVIGQLRGGTASVPEAITLMITTMSDVAPTGWWSTELTKARAIRDGTLDLPGYLPAIWEPTSEYRTLADCADPRLFQLTNPNIGYSVSLDWLKNAFREALAVGETETKRFLSQHANFPVAEYISSTESDWHGAKLWNGAADPAISLDRLIETSRRITLGFDGGGADDLSSLAVLGEMADDTWQTWSHAWLWPGAIDLRPKIASQLRDFQTAGDLTVCPAGEDFDQMQVIFEKVYNSGKFVSFGMDPAGVASDLARQLSAGDAALRRQMVAIKQGYALRSAYTALERRLESGSLQHAGQGLMAFCVQNAKCDPSSGLITKRIAGGASKIDGLVALAVAAMCMLEAEAPLPDDIGYWIG